VAISTLRPEVMQVTWEVTQVCINQDKTRFCHRSRVGVGVVEILPRKAPGRQDQFLGDLI
jgi:hypothetical protein